jgi:hypothetical protein
MDENLDEEKATNIIKSINSIKISNIENETQNQTNIQNNDINPENPKINNIPENKSPSNIENINSTNNDNNISDQNINPNKNISEPKHKKKEKKGMVDLGFQFPLAKPISKVEIPFAFQQNLNSQKNDNRFHSYITIKDTPKLYIDISDDNKMDNFLLANKIESLKGSNQKLENKLNSIDTNIMQFQQDNDFLREQIEKLKREILISDQNIDYNKKQLEQINFNNNKIINEINQKICEKNTIFENLQKNYENIETDIKKIDNEENKNDILYEIKEQINIIQKNNYNNLKYYKNKFIKNINISEECIHQTLQKDIMDFMNLVTFKISIIKPKVNELINLIQDSVEKSIGNEYEVKLYGSHATGLCLPWSDIDVVLCKKDGNNNSNQNNNLYSNKYMPLHDLFTYLQKSNDFRSINYIGATSVPLIKIKTKENIDIKNVDISLQDNTHYGIKCVSLVLNYKQEYEVLLPMVLALKNILKQANLNDPYTVSIFFYI